MLYVVTRTGFLNIQIKGGIQMAEGESSGGVGAVAIIAILVILLLAVFVVFKSGLLGGRSVPSKVDVNIQTPGSGK
jgi:hypothetical protein